jgi:hypothetical protein
MLVSMLPKHVTKLIVFGCLSAATGGFLCAAQPAGQSLVAVQTKLNLDGGSVTLDGPWQFHLGDDQTWANPAFDDSAWEQLTTDEPWGAQGHPNESGFAWYRRHIAPYLQGEELAVESGLPLGLDAAATYSESTFALQTTHQLTLMTDGVVEARSKTGELYGFERSAAVSGQAADEIAKTAELFGQDDDITVLTLQRTVPA